MVNLRNLMPYSRYLTIVLVIFYTHLLKGQTGDAFLQQYEVPIPNLDNRNLDAVQGMNGWMFFANTKGVLVYDGVRWELVETFTTPYALVYDKENEVVFVGCRDNFGYIYVDDKGRTRYQSISREGDADLNLMGLEVRFAQFKDLGNRTGKSFGQITRVQMTPKYVFFYSDKEFFRITRKNKRFSKSWKLPNFEDRFSGFFIHKENIYLNIAGKGIHFIDRTDETLKFLEGGERFQYLYIRTSLNYDGQQTLLGADNSWHYLFDGEKFTLFFFVEEEFLKASQLSFNLNIDDDTFATATLTGGVIVVQKRTGKTKYIINYQTGLPDDEILALAKDNLGGLWICHDQGITRADLQIPIKTFSSYAGLDGSVTTSTKVGDSLFVGTSKGLFYISKVEKFEEVEGYIKKESKYFQQIKTITKIIRITEPTDKQNFRKYNRNEQRTKDPTTERRRINTKETNTQTKAPAQVVSVEESTRKFTSSEKRQAYALASIPYIFKRVEGLDSKVKQLLNIDNQLLVATNVGLYVVTSQEKTPLEPQLVLKDIAINFIAQHPQIPQQVYIGTTEGLRQITFENGAWKEVEKLKNLDENIYTILCYDQNLWLGAENRIVRVKLDSLGNIQEYQKGLPYFSYPFEESYSETVPVRLIDNKIAVFLSTGIYSYNGQKNLFLKDKSLQQYFNARAGVIYNQANFTWTDALNQWTVLEQSQKSQPIATFMELFKEITDIYVDKQQNLWIVEEGNLHMIDATKATQNSLKSYQNQFDILLRSVRNPNGGYFPLEDSLTVNYGDTTVSFNFQLAAPFYQQESDIQYQYWLEGMGNKNKPKWSDWDRQAIISFPFLPSGKYTLHIRARNIFGQSIEKKVFTLEIEPPFWETTLFYALQTLFFTGLLILSFVLSRSQKSIFAKASYVLSFITIITLFEFLILLIEPYVDDASGGIPVFKLGMNIVLALTLAPAEQLLRQALRRNQYGAASKVQKITQTYGRREGAEGPE